MLKRTLILAAALVAVLVAATVAFADDPHGHEHSGGDVPSCRAVACLPIACTPPLPTPAPRCQPVPAIAVPCTPPELPYEGAPGQVLRVCRERPDGSLRCGSRLRLVPTGRTEVRP